MSICKFVNQILREREDRAREVVRKDSNPRNEGVRVRNWESFGRATKSL